MYLGIDIGTSSVKAVLIDQDGAIVTQASDPLTVSRPAPGFSEQDPQAWWQATVTAVRSLPAAQRAAVRAVGLSGQMHGATLLDEKDRPCVRRSFGTTVAPRGSVSISSIASRAHAPSPATS